MVEEALSQSNPLMKGLKSIINFFKKPMVKYIFVRLFNSIITLFLIVAAVFLLMRLIPESRYIDYETINRQPPQIRERLIQAELERIGRDKPALVQLGDYFKWILPFEDTVCVDTAYTPGTYEPICEEYATYRIYFGTSITYSPGREVMPLILERFPISFMISILALIITYIVSLPLGVYMAKNKGGWVDRIGNGYIVLTSAVPALVFYYLWQILGMRVGLSGFFDIYDVTSWIMPVWAIAFLSIAGQTLWVRRFMVDEMNADYVKFSRSTGISEQSIMFKHVLRNAIVPLIRRIPSALIFAVVGSYFVESLWNIGGSGTLFIDALQNKPDTVLVQALTIVYSSMSIIANLLGDIITVFFDPRISLTKNK